MYYLYLKLYNRAESGRQSGFRSGTQADRVAEILHEGYSSCQGETYPSVLVSNEIHGQISTTFTSFLYDKIFYREILNAMLFIKALWAIKRIIKTKIKLKKNNGVDTISLMTSNQNI